MRSGLWRLVKGVELKPSRASPDKPTAEELRAEDKWEDKQMKAAGELFLNVLPDQRTHFAGLEDDPVAMWAALEKVHLQKRPGARFNAYDDLFC